MKFIKGILLIIVGIQFMLFSKNVTTVEIIIVGIMFSLEGIVDIILGFLEYYKRNLLNKWIKTRNNGK